MECYNCGAKLGKGDICQNCGANVKIYKKIIMASNAYYNDALEKAAVRDLSGAIESLRTSLRFYKMNIDARNLLGLVYFETGEVVEALTEWVISKNYQPRDNAASRYLNEIQNNPSRLDTINQTIKKYNQALLYCRQDSRDLAIIQLKKVLSLNPKLVSGHHSIFRHLQGHLHITLRQYRIKRRQKWDSITALPCCKLHKIIDNIPGLIINKKSAGRCVHIVCFQIDQRDRSLVECQTSAFRSPEINRCFCKISRNLFLCKIVCDMVGRVIDHNICR